MKIFFILFTDCTTFPFFIVDDAPAVGLYTKAPRNQRSDGERLPVDLGQVTSGLHLHNAEGMNSNARWQLILSGLDEKESLANQERKRNAMLISWGSDPLHFPHLPLSTKGCQTVVHPPYPRSFISRNICFRVLRYLRDLTDSAFNQAESVGAYSSRELGECFAGYAGSIASDRI